MREKIKKQYGIELSGSCLWQHKINNLTIECYMDINGDVIVVQIYGNKGFSVFVEAKRL